ncbi:hypothetical protein [Aquipuribacter hungaricus]|uniref:hypothetical protein n=1 Tax=Aquipuribacter hungaricus TaxID=545624 RepID=UPI0036111BCB
MPDPGAVDGVTAAATRAYLVKAPAAGRYDCLWRIAEDELGDGARWAEIYDLNVALPQPDGSALSDPDIIKPGWQLRMPADAAHLPAWTPTTMGTGTDTTDVSPGSPAPPGQHVVTAGESLWEIAESELGDGNRFPELAAAASGVPQPDGQELTDPDVIRPGWVIPVPAVTETTNNPVAPAPAPTPAPVLKDLPSAPDVALPEAQGPAGDRGGLPAVGDAALPGTGQGAVERSGRADDRNEAGRTTPAAGTLEVGPVVEAGDDAEDDADAVSKDVDPAWLVTGLSGAGTVLAAGMLLLLRQRRRGQARARRPGRALTLPGPALFPTERSVLLSEPAVEVVARLDEILRRLGTACGMSGEPLPAVAAVALDEAGIVLHLSRPTVLPAPWSGSTDGLRWLIPPTADATEVGPLEVDQPAPFPVLVTVGADETGATWLLNLEGLGAVRVVGDTDRAFALVRYMAAELACSLWSDGVRVECVGVGEELSAMNPDRLRIHDNGDTTGDRVAADRVAGDLFAGDLFAGAVATIDRGAALGLDVPEARARQAGDDSWPARVLLIDASRRTPALDELTALLQAHPGRTGTSVVLLEAGGADNAEPGDAEPGDAEPGDAELGDAASRDVSGVRHSVRPAKGWSGSAVVVRVGASGRLVLPVVGSQLTAVGLSSQEAHGCAALYAVGGLDTPMPTTAADGGAADGWRSWADDAGSIRDEHTLPRHDTPDLVDRTMGAGAASAARPGPDTPARRSQHLGDDVAADHNHDPETEVAGIGPDEEKGRPAGVLQPQSLLPMRDEEYLVVAATTPQDLDALAPQVSVQVRHAVAEADPGLDADVDAWFSDTCELPRLTLLGPIGARTRGTPVTKRKPYWTELLAFLATRPHGATPEEVADAFGITATKTRDYVRVVRDWLGTNPRTRNPHLPDARLSAAGRLRGVGVYQVEDLLVDADLFRRLRLRGETRGAAGIADLRTALSLVSGPPFDKQRPGGWSWLVEGDRLDQHMLCAVVDVAHLVATHLLQVGDLPAARATAELAATAAPYEEIPRLDLAAVAAAGGHPEAAEQIVRGQVCNRSDDGGPPDELPERSQQIIDRHGWLSRGTRAKLTRPVPARPATRPPGVAPTLSSRDPTSWGTWPDLRRHLSPRDVPPCVPPASPPASPRP